MNVVRIILLLAYPLMLAAEPSAPPRDLRQLLQEGLFEEEANRNLDKASAAYEALVQAFETQRQYGATAIYRLAEVRVKQGRKEEAIRLFQRVVAEFSSNEPL